MRMLRKIIHELNTAALWLGCTLFLLTMLVAILNMILRPMGHPLMGSFEIMGFGCAMLTALGLGYSQETRSHIRVDLLFNRFPGTLKRCLNILAMVISSAFFSMAAYRLMIMAIQWKEYGELSETLRIPFYPVVLVVAAGFLLLSLNLLTDAIETADTTANGGAGSDKKASSHQARSRQRFDRAR